MILTNGLALNCCSHARRKTSDIPLFHGNQEFHGNALKKSSEDARKIDIGILSAEYPSSFAVQVDKGYQDLGNEISAIHPSRQPPHGKLLQTERRENDKIAHDRVILENYFGWLCTLWTVFGSKYR